VSFSLSHFRPSLPPALPRSHSRSPSLRPLDYVLTHSPLARSIDAITAHGSYWSDVRFSTFVLTQLFSDPQRLEENGREQVGIEEEDEPHET